MDPSASDQDISSSLPNTLAIGGALVLVAGALIHRHQDRISSLFLHRLIEDDMADRINWNELTIPARVRSNNENISFT